MIAQGAHWSVAATVRPFHPEQIRITFEKLYTDCSCFFD